MELLELMKSRYSLRSYSTKQIEKEKLDLILEAGRIAPTAANRQTQKILVVQSESGLEILGRSAKTYNPPLILVVCSEKEKSWKNSFDGRVMNDIDCSIVSTQMMLMAKSLGIDSLWVNKFDPEILYRELAIPKEYVIVNLLELGYASDDYVPPSMNRHDESRKAITETVFYEKF